jgi:hypothetical protein
MNRYQHWSLALGFATLTGCAATERKAEPRIGFEEARKTFESRGVQPNQPLPALSLVDLQGKPTSIADAQRARPLVLVTASLTCNVARRNQTDVNAVREHYGEKVAVVVVYTIDAHPKGDMCPYTGKEWVPKDNERDKVLVPQPLDLQQRLTLARQFSDRYAKGVTVVVDSMDNASWKALGEAPNLGLLVDRAGTVKLRQGWFERAGMEHAVDKNLAATSAK